MFVKNIQGAQLKGNQRNLNNQCVLPFEIFFKKQFNLSPSFKYKNKG